MNPVRHTAHTEVLTVFTKVRIEISKVPTVFSKVLTVFTKVLTVFRAPLVRKTMREDSTPARHTIKRKNLSGFGKALQSYIIPQRQQKHP